MGLLAMLPGIAMAGIGVATGNPALIAAGVGSLSGGAGKGGIKGAIGGGVSGGLGGPGAGGLKGILAGAAGGAGQGGISGGLLGGAGAGLIGGGLKGGGVTGALSPSGGAGNLTQMLQGASDSGFALGGNIPQSNLSSLLGGFNPSQQTAGPQLRNSLSINPTFQNSQQGLMSLINRLNPGRGNSGFFSNL